MYYYQKKEKEEIIRKKKYHQLTIDDITYLRIWGIINGCGGAGNKIKNRILRYLLKKTLHKLRLVFIEASCDIHDFTYWQGGDEKRRLECDQGFFQKIIEDIRRIPIGFFSTLGYTLLALIFYYAVRVGGKDYFNYTDTHGK